MIDKAKIVALAKAKSAPKKKKHVGVHALRKKIGAMRAGFMINKFKKETEKVEHEEEHKEIPMVRRATRFGRALRRRRCDWVEARRFLPPSGGDCSHWRVRGAGSADARGPSRRSHHARTRDRSQ